MEFQYQDGTVTVISEKKDIVLTPDRIMLDGLVVDSAGEYEKSGFLLYVREYDGVRVAHFRAEGLWIGYMPSLAPEIDGDTLDFLGQLDILIAPIGKKEHSTLEKIEPRLLVSYGATACEMPQVLGIPCEIVSSYKLKSTDISSEKTGLVLLG